MPIKDLVVIVTGASAGIGAAIARALLREGASVMLTARRAERLAALATEMAGAPGRCAWLAGDIQDPAFGAQLVTATLERFGRVDVLINNAGLGHRSHLSDLPHDHLHTIIATNLYGVLYTTQAVLPTLRAQGSGQIINVSSIVGQRPLPRSAVYAASKAALNMVSRALRIELRGSGITVTLLYPGLTETEFHKGVLGGARRRVFPGVAAERVARVTLRAIRKRQREVYVTPLDWAFTHLNRLFPRLSDWLTGLLWRG